MSIVPSSTTQQENIKHLPAQVLFDLARNESASKEYRKAAVKMLVDAGHQKAQHPELRELFLEIKAEKDAEKEVESIVADAEPEDHAPSSVEDITAVPLSKADVDSADFGYAKASITTASLGAPEVSNEKVSPANEAESK